MPLDLSNTLVIGIASTALFDLTEADNVFRTKYEKDRDTAIDEYRQYMLKRENNPLADGTGMPLVKALLELNKNYQAPDEPPLVEVVVMSRNSPETGVRVMNNIRSQKLNISRYAFTGGESVVDYLDAFDVDLFLTTDVSDAQAIIDSRSCALLPSFLLFQRGRYELLSMVTLLFLMKAANLFIKQRGCQASMKMKTYSRIFQCLKDPMPAYF
jgi:5'-nucleotidase